MKADWRHLDGLNIESVGSVNWLGYLWTDMSNYVLLCYLKLSKNWRQLGRGQGGLLVLVK